MYAVCVTFELTPGSAPAFMPLMRANARTSLQTEAGCHQFDVAHNPDQPGSIFLYELYTDRAAFDTHLTSAHFKAFDLATRDMIASKTVTTWSEVDQ